MLNISDHPLFNEKITGKYYSNIIDSSQIITLKAKEHLISHGIVGRNLFLISNGLLKLFTKADRNNRVLFKLASSGDVFGTECLFSQNPYLYSASAAIDSQVYIISSPVVEKIFLEEPEFTAALMHHIHKWNYDITTDRINSFRFHIHARIARLLLLLSDEVFFNNTFKLPLTHEEIASLFDTSRETVTRIFINLTEDRIITRNAKQISIYNRSLLEVISKDAF